MREILAISKHQATVQRSSTTNRYPKKNHYHEFSISDIIKDLKWDTLEQRRNKARVTTAYKLINNNLILPPDLLPFANLRPTRSTDQVRVGPEYQLHQPYARLNTVNKTFFYSTPKTWNQLVTPQQARAPSVDAFKDHFT